MSPVARRQGGGHTGKAVLVALVGVAFALGTAFIVANLASTGDVQVRLGDDRFDAGRADDVLDDIIEREAPLGFGDVANSRRPIWLDNEGTDPEEGWIAFLALEPTDDTCVINWKADRNLYVSDCDSTVTFPRSGTGLRAYEVTVEEGRLFVDIFGAAGRSENGE